MQRDLRERYEQDLALVRGAAAWLALAAALIGLAVFPWYAPSYLVFTAILVSVNAIVALGLNLLTGYTGQISLGHAGFVAIGAYTSGLLMSKLGVTWWLAWPAAGIVAAAFGFLVGLPALRLTGPYLVIATLGFGIAVHQVLTNWEALSGGRMGLPVPQVTFGPAGLTAEQRLYYLAVGGAVLLTWVAFNLTRSHVGRAFVAIRDSDIAAEVVGVNLTRYKTLAFAVSAFYAGIAGALFGQALRHIEPQSFTLVESIFYFAMIVIGGLASIPGALIGAVVLTVLPQQLTLLREWVPLIFGSAIILMMVVEPKGLYGRWLRVKLYFRTWPL
ncbi:MAG: amino acid/amide ABC transporter membrane protein 2, HAAT family [Armatimonadetes bacterium CSP1-3]|nr:MAG: amino acid/amide ABC transporter membrane protein 2, HAAT family [Armatimonadetes bacterium CSP1-3]